MDDLISRQAAIDAPFKKFDMGTGVTWIPLEYVEQLPSVQPEPCEDAVSRDSVKFLLCKETCHPGAFCPDGFCGEICEKVDALPSATPKQRMGEWIPVSERLPEEDDYKSCIECLDGAVWYFTENGTMGLGYYYKSTKEWSTTDDLKTDGIVVAWKSLPGPYRAERRTD